jgi:hypothetical protein
MLIFTPLTANASREDAERDFAAALSARIALGATVDAHSKAAERRMKQIGVGSIVIKDFEGRNAMINRTSE